jgi:hypothetical protein
VLDDPIRTLEIIFKSGGIGLLLAGIGLYLGWPHMTGGSHKELFGPNEYTPTGYTNHLGVHTKTYEEALRAGFGIVFAGAIIGLIIGRTLVWLGLFKKETLGLSDD